jgi:glucosylceramidase
MTETFARRQAIAFLGAAAAAAPIAARAADLTDRIEWRQTTDGDPWRKVAPPSLAALPGGLLSTDATIRLDAPGRSVAGFGGAISEKGWQALATLPDALRWSVMEALFGPDGCNFSLCRTPIGANDISRGWYSYDETPGDFALKDFSVANDRDTLIPFIKAAQQLQPRLKLWASPWSPPTWMKRNGHYAMAAAWPGQPSNGIRPDQLGKEGEDWFIQDDRYFDTYAQYFRRYVEEYASVGIPIGMVMPQNEFNSAQPFPSCCWTPQGLARFLPFLGKEMEKVGAQVFFGTLERGNPDLLDQVLQHSAAQRTVKGIGMQWAGKGALPVLRARHPDLEIWGSEQECGVGTNDWHYARYGWSTIKRYFTAGATAWQYWNLVMPTGGMSGWGWPQNSLVEVDTKRRKYRLTNDYWLMRHIAAPVRPDAQLVSVESFVGFDDQIAFLNPDGSLILVASNAIGNRQTVRYVIGNRMLELKLAPDSLNTITIPRAMLS